MNPFADPIHADPYSDYVFILRKDGRTIGTLRTGNPEVARALAQRSEGGVVVEFLGDFPRVRVEEPEDISAALFHALSES